MVARVNIKVAMIDDFSLYSQNLINEGLAKEVEVVFYGPRSWFRDKFDLEYQIIKSKRVWTPQLYPFQIFKQVVIDRPSVVHIQYEVNTFGPLYTNLLFPFLLLLLKTSGSKIVVTMHSTFTGREINSMLFPFQVPQVLIRFILSIFYKLMEKLADVIVVHALTFKKLLVEYYNLPANKIRIIPHGVSANKPAIKILNLKDLASCLRDRRVILYFGVLSPRKGLEYLLKAYAKVAWQCPRCVLVIAGEEPAYYKGYRRKLESLAKFIGVEHEVVFTGFISDKDIHTLFSLAEVIVLPYIFSVSASGPLSIAMQYHKPVVVTRTRYFSEALEDGEDALLVPPKDSEELANAIINLVKDESLRRRLSRNIKMKVEKYSSARVAQKTLKLYLNVLEK